MSYESPIFTNFTAGEISPRLEGRVDLKDYFSACRVLENFIIVTQGGVDRPPGTYFVADTKTSDKKVRLIPFESGTTKYILEFGHEYMRVFKDHAQVMDGGAPYELDTGDNYDYTEDELFEIQYYQNEDTMWLVHPNHVPKTIITAGDTSWTITEETFSAGAGEEDFSAANHYPSCITFFEDRLWFGNTNTQPQTFWGSVVGSYTDFTLGTGADDAFEYTIPTKYEMKWLLSKNNVLVGTGGGNWVLTGAGDIISPANPPRIQHQTSYGCKNYQAFHVNENALYIQSGGKRIREFSYNRDIDNYVAVDLTILADHITESGIVDMALQSQPETILWCIRDDGELVGLTYEKRFEINGWHRHITDGNYESMAIISGDDEDEIWVSVKREQSSKRYIEYFKPRDYGTDQDDAFFVHSGVTWEGSGDKSISNATQADPVVITTTTNHGFSDGDMVRIEDVEGMTELNDNVYEIDTTGMGADEFKLKLEDGSDYLDGSGFTAYDSGGTVYTVADTVEGLDHLEDTTVDVLTDGAVHPDRDVDKGEISLAWYTRKVHAGLEYVSKLKPMKLETGVQSGTAQYKIKKIFKTILRIYKSLGFKVGPDEDNLDEVTFRIGNDEMDKAIPLYTGDKEIEFEGQYDQKGDLIIVQDYPLPLNILALILEVTTYE